MNKELYRLEVGDLKIESVDFDGKFLINFELGREFKIEDYHGQDCCESVYADFSVLKYYKDDILGKKIARIMIKGIEEMGFIINLEVGWGDWVKIFIPCYNSQNGYYSDDLSLNISENITGTNTKQEIDITNFKENNID